MQLGNMETGVVAAASAALQQLLNTTATTLISTATTTTELHITGAAAINGTASGVLYKNTRRMLVSIFVMSLGVIGNLLALIILARKKHNKNSKYTFMLR